MHLRGPQQLVRRLGRQIQQSNSSACFCHCEGEVLNVKVWKGLDVVAATVVTDNFFELFNLFGSPVNEIVPSLVVISRDEKVI